MLASSKILIVIICSNSKITGGYPYNPNNSTYSLLPLPPKQKNGLIERRRKIFALLHSDEVSRHGVPLNKLKYNCNLMAGPDFSGEASASYLPAIDRYQGRFYTELQHLDGIQRLKDSAHHVLILSGLYGLLTPLEYIQAYSCHLRDDDSIAATWTKDGFLTSLILDYVNKFNITRIFDITGDAIYRQLVDWHLLHEEIKGGVLHAFGQQNAGPAVLKSLAALMCRHILMESENSLLNIGTGQHFLQGDVQYEKVSLEDSDIPPKGWPCEDERKVDVSQI